MDWPIETAVSSPAQTEIEIENKRVAEVQKCHTILHRWKDTSHGEGFDVIVYPDAIVSLHPTAAAPSKVVVFPSSNAVKVRAIYTVGNGKTRQASASVRGGNASKTALGIQPPSGLEILSYLRICLRDAKADSETTSDADIVLTWKEKNKK